MKTLRILIITGNFYNNKDGVSITLHKLADYLHNKSIRVLVIAPYSGKKSGKPYPVIEAPSLPVPFRTEYQFSMGFSKKIKQQILQFAPAIIHIATPDLLGCSAIRLAKKYQIPVVTSLHTNFLDYLPYYHLSWLKPLVLRYGRWFYGQCEDIYCPSESIYRFLIKNNIQHTKKIWGRGVSHEMFNPERRSEQWRRDRNIRNDRIIVTWVSRLVKEKNLLLFIEAIKQSMARFPQILPLIVGDGPMLPSARQQLPNAHFAEFLESEALAEAYANSDIFVFPSVSETFGSVTLEAMACGLPCVVADSPGSRCLVSDNVTGHVIRELSASNFSMSINHLVQHPAQRKAFGKKGYQKSLSYRTDACNETLLNYYKACIEKYRLR